jgi:hypothetical protein
MIIRRLRFRHLSIVSGGLLFMVGFLPLACDSEKKIVPSIRIVEILPKGHKPSRPEVVMATSPQLRQRMAQGGAILSPNPPRGWPSSRAWRPRRNFGPFFLGSHLEHIHLFLIMSISQGILMPQSIESITDLHCQVTHQPIPSSAVFLESSPERMDSARLR